jgi:uncharacterized protein DUF6510
VYAQAPGAVARCVGCEAVLIRLVRGPDRAWLDLRGLVCLEIGLAEIGLAEVGLAEVGPQA